VLPAPSLPLCGAAARASTRARFCSDTTGACLIAVPTLIRNGWPMRFFMVFKSPNEGQTHTFRSGEPMAQTRVTASFRFGAFSMRDSVGCEHR